jgi:hypothetical protein
MSDWTPHVVGLFAWALPMLHVRPRFECELDWVVKENQPMPPQLLGHHATRPSLIVAADTRSGALGANVVLQVLPTLESRVSQ